MKPLWMWVRSMPVSPARSAGTRLWCCGHSANFSGSPAPGSALRLRRRSSPLAFLQNSVRGRSPGRRWRSARNRLIAAADRLRAILLSAGLEIVGGTALFQLTRISPASDLFHYLGRAGILVRSFPEHPTWLRFGLPGTEKAWARLQMAMAAYAGTH
jgi:hypothetical protein